MRYQGACFPFDPLDKTPPVVSFSPPIRTRSVGTVVLTSNEPATIFVTTDDTEPTAESLNEPDQLVLPNLPDDVIVRYFAIDLAGNQSAEQTVIWRIDSEGTAPVTAFDVDIAMPTRTVTWDPPPDSKLGGVVLARVDGQLTKAPVSGTEYAVGDLIEPGVTVVQVDAPGVPGMFSESLPQSSGIVRYVAWGFDDLRNYGPPAGDFELVNLPQQPLQFGRVTITPSNATVTISESDQPTLMNVAATATVASSTVTAKITLRNETGRVMHAPKMVIQTLTSPATVSSQQGQIASRPFMRYGSLLQPGASITTTWTFGSVNVNTNLVIDFEVRENPLLIAANQDNLTSGGLLDQVTAQQSDTIDAGLPGPRNGRNAASSGGFTPDGRLIMGSRLNGSVSSFDLASGKRLKSIELRPQKSHVAQVVLDRGGVLGYALIGENHRKGYQNGGSVESFIVRFDAATLEKHGELAIGPSRNRRLELTSDGKFLVVATGNAAQGTVVVDLQTFTIARRILLTKPDVVVLADPRTAYIVGGRIEKVDITTGDSLATFDLPSAGGSKLHRAALAGPDRLWVTRSFQNPIIIDVSGNNAAPITVSAGSGTLLEVFDNTVFFGGRFAAVRRFQFDGSPEGTPDLNPNNVRGHWLGRSPF